MRRLILFSERTLLRAGLRALLDARAEPWQVSECGARHSLLAQMAESRPDMALVDLSAEFSLGFLEELRSSAPQCHFLLIAENLAPELLFHMTEAGSYGVVSLRSPVDRFFEYLEAASAGRAMIDPIVLPEGLAQESIRLTPREAQLVSLLAQGMKNKEIAAALHLSEGTVKVYLSHLYGRLRVKDRFELALCGLRNMAVLGNAARKTNGQAAADARQGDADGALILDWSHPEGERMRTPLRRRRASV